MSSSLPLFEEQLDSQHLFMETRECRVCGVEKDLTADFYKCRKDGTLRSSYSYECKECAKKRVLGNYHNASLGTCTICETVDVKLVKGMCKSCNKILKISDHNIDTLEKIVLYLRKLNDEKSI